MAPRASGDRLVRSPNVVLFWKGNRLFLEEFARRKRIAANPAAVPLLHFFSTPKSARAAVASLPEYTPKSVAGEIRKLVRLGFLVPDPCGTARRNIASAWNDSLAAAYYHFSTRDLRYARSVQTQIAILRRRLREQPQPLAFKTYPKARRVRLAREALVVGAAPLEAVLNRRRSVRDFARSAVAFPSFAAAVCGTWGQTGWLDGGVLGRLVLKTSPSAGARHPVECYVLVHRVDGVAPGIYHFNVRESALELLREGDVRAVARSLASGQDWAARCGFVCVMTVVAARTFWKYPSSDAYRLFLLDAGHLAQTFCLIAAAQELGAFTTAAIQESRIERLLGLDGVHEFPLYLCGAGIPAKKSRWKTTTVAPQPPRSGGASKKSETSGRRVR